MTEDVYIELVCSLFATLVPTIIISVSFILVGSWIVVERHDELLFALFVLTMIAALWRIGLLVVHREEVRTKRFAAVRAGQIERRFAVPYFAFALFFGLFAARGFVLGANEHRLLILGLVFGYGAGVAAGISLRPWIAVPSALLAITPLIAASFFVPGRWSTGLLTALFLAGGIESMLRRYQATSRLFSMQRLLSTIDRRDGLTGLPNRIMLRERFADLTAAVPGTAMVAVHCLILDRLEGINEDRGYPAGDAILRAVGERIDRLTRGEAETFGARLGGVEFVIVQPGLFQPRHAELFAAAIVEATTRAYIVAGQELRIGAHVGYALALQHGADLDRLLKDAAAAAHRAREDSRDVAGHHVRGWQLSAGPAEAMRRGQAARQAAR